MIYLLLFGGLIAIAGVIAAARKGAAARSDHGPLTLHLGENSLTTTS